MVSPMRRGGPPPEGDRSSSRLRVRAARCAPLAAASGPSLQRGDTERRARHGAVGQGGSSPAALYEGGTAEFLTPGLLPGQVRPSNPRRSTRCGSAAFKRDQRPVDAHAGVVGGDAQHVADLAVAEVARRSAAPGPGSGWRRAARERRARCGRSHWPPPPPRASVQGRTARSLRRRPSTGPIGQGSQTGWSRPSRSQTRRVTTVCR